VGVTADVVRPLDVAATVALVAALATDAGRDDLATRLGVAAARVRRPATIVCVVGEFKQGKSSLVNAMLGRAICPVDDDLATSAITLVRYGPEPHVDVRRRVDDEVVVETIDLSSLPDWVCEQGNPENAKSVERVDISLPSPLLASGLAIVDTPGMGGLGAGHAAATLAFLPFADGLIFVSDASAELSAPEAEFLERASELCPNVLFALTKTDLYPAWRQIAATDETRRSGAADAILPVSSMLSGAAAELGDETLAATSGVPALLDELESAIIGPAKSLAAERGTSEAVGVLDQLEHQFRVEHDALTDPARAAGIVAEVAAATARLENLRGPGARWSVLVADRISDLSNNAGHQFRKAMRDVSRDMDESIEVLKTPQDWDELARRLQTDVAEAVTARFVEIERTTLTIRQDVIELLGAEGTNASQQSSQRHPLDVASFWTDKGIDPNATRHVGQQLGSALTGLRGAQSGIIMFGMVGRFLPAGAAALMLSNPVTIGIGAVFAGVQLNDAHKRKIIARRQQARVNVRQFLDEVQFSVSNEMGEVMRDVQRSIRDEFTALMSELARTFNEAAQRAQSVAQQSGEASRARAVEVAALLDRVAQARQVLAPPVTA
jgi:hypothetical protein